MGRVLIIDDEEDLVEVCQMILEATGRATRAVVRPSAVDLLEVVRESQPSLVLLDLEMPGMSGAQVTRLLRGQPDTRLIPIVIMSASPDAEAAARHLRADAFLPKPFS